MAANITQFGRVEFDPMRVPQLSGSTERPESAPSFERELADASRSFDGNDRTGELAERAGDPARDPDGARSRADSRELERAPAATGSEPAPAEDSTSNGTPESSDSVGITRAGTDANQIREGEAPVLGERASKGAGAPPSSFSHPTSGEHLAESLGASHANRASRAAAGAALAPPANTTQGAQQAAPAIRETTATSGKTAATEAPVGYRTLHLPTLQAAESARDSIFRQIALHLMPGGGEMHVLLDPPQLGELEMKLVVDGDKLRLAVIAERPEVAAMMQKHMAELRQHLATQGLTVTDAEVRARDPHESAGRDADSRGSRFLHQDRNEDDAPQAAPRMSRNFITAEGLDFWI